MPRRSAWLALLGLALVAACSSGLPDERRPAPGQGARPPSSGSSDSPTTPRSPRPPRSHPDVLTLAFAGDLNFDQQMEPLLDDPQHRLATALRPLLAHADLAILNLETAITARGEPEPKTYHFRAPPTALDVVASTGVDVVTMANNHAVDFGPLGFADTLAAKGRSPIPVVGIGRDADEAFAPAVIHRGGLSIAVLGSTEIDDLTLNKFPATAASPGVATNLDPARLVAAVRAAAAAYDLVVVYLHWGLDYTSCPDPVQPAMAARLTAAGADVVVGSHAHRVEGGGWLDRAYVDYGLGNFVWARNDGDNGVSGVLSLTIDVSAVLARERDPAGRRNVSPLIERAAWTPLLVGDDGIPRRPDAPTRTAMRQQWQQARSCTDLSGRPG